MGKDFRIGLVLGLMLAVVTLVWVATRPSLRPQARAVRAQESGFQVADSGLNEGGRADPQSAKGPPTPAHALGEPAASGQIDRQSQSEADATWSQNIARRAADERQRTQTAAPLDPQSTITNPQSTLPDQTIYERSEKIKTTRFHIVRRGETLSAISRQYYGTPNSWQKILAANQETIKDPDRITPGTKLILPE